MSSSLATESSNRMNQMRSWQARRVTRRSHVATVLKGAPNSNNRCFTIAEDEEFVEEVVPKTVHPMGQQQKPQRNRRRRKKSATAPPMLRVHIPRPSEVPRSTMRTQQRQNNPKHRYSPYRRNPISGNSSPLVMPGGFPSDEILSLPPHIIETPEYWTAVREASVQRSRINPFAEPTHLPITETMLRHQIDPSLWYGAAPALPVEPVEQAPLPSPSSPSAWKLSVGAALAALKSPLLPKNWSPVYTDEEMARQREEQRSRTYKERVAIAWDNFWGTQSAQARFSLLLPPPQPPSGPSLSQRPQSWRAQVAMETADYSPREVGFSLKMATREEFLHALSNTGRFRMDRRYRGRFLRYYNEPASLIVEVDESNGQSVIETMDRHKKQQSGDREERMEGLDFEPYEKLYANRFDPALRRRAEQAKRLRVQAEAQAQAQAQAQTEPQTQTTPPSLSPDQTALVKAINKAIYHMQTNNKPEAQTTIALIRELLGEPLIQELLLHVGLYMATVAVLRFVGLSPGTVMGNRAVEMALVKGFSYVLKPEARVWNLGLQ